MVGEDCLYLAGDRLLGEPASWSTHPGCLAVFEGRQLGSGRVDERIVDLRVTPERTREIGTMLEMNLNRLRQSRRT